MANRVTQQVVEALRAFPSKARVTQQVTEVLSKVPSLGNRVTQQVLEVLVRIPKRFTVGFAGASSFSPTVLGRKLLTPTFNGKGSFTVTLRGKLALHPTFVGKGSLVATLIGSRTMTPTFAGRSTLSTTLSLTHAMRPTFAGKTSFAASLIGTRLLTPIFAGKGSLTAALAASGGATRNFGATFDGQASFRAQFPIIVPASAVLQLLADAPTVYPVQPQIEALLFEGDAPLMGGWFSPAASGQLKLIGDPARITFISDPVPGALQFGGDAPTLPAGYIASGGGWKLRGDAPTVYPLQPASGNERLRGDAPAKLPYDVASGRVKLAANGPTLWLLKTSSGQLRLKADPPTTRLSGFDVESGVLLLLAGHPIVTPLTEPHPGPGTVGEGQHVAVIL